MQTAREASFSPRTLRMIWIGLPITSFIWRTVKAFFPETLRRYGKVTGEPWQIKAIAKELVIHVEEGEHGTRALVKNSRRLPDDQELTVAAPTIEELMYFMTKR